MDVVLGAHGLLAWALVLYYAAVGIWGIALGLRRGSPTPGFRGAIVIAEVVAIGQGALGLLVLLFLHGPSEPLHILYGFALAAAMPLALSFVRDRTPPSQALWLGVAALFTAGLAIRGITTS